MNAAAKPKGKNLADFRAAHDKSFIVPKKIEAGIAALGADGWEYELSFIKLAGLSVTDLSQFREGFEDFIVAVGGKNAKRCWCGSKDLAKKLRAMT